MLRLLKHAHDGTVNNEKGEVMASVVQALMLINIDEVGLDDAQ